MVKRVLYFLAFLIVAPLLLIYWIIHAICFLGKQKPLDDIPWFEENNLQRLIPFQLKFKELNDEINSKSVNIERKIACARECVALYDDLWRFCAETPGGQQWYAAMASEPCQQAQLALSEYSALLSKLEEFHHTFFPISSPDEKIQSDWEVIPCDHNAHDQIVRQKRSIRTVPIYIDHDALVGFFFSPHSNTVYFTQLFTCDCPDFEKRCLPCKHIYRLFYELTVDTLNTTVPDMVASALYRLTDQDRVDLIVLVYSLLPYPDSSKTVIKSAQISLFIDLGFINQINTVSDTDYSFLLQCITKDEILISLRDYGISDCRPSWSKQKVIDWVIENHRDYLLKKFSEHITITIPPTLRAWYSGIVDRINAVNLPDTDSIKEWDMTFDEFL